MTSTSLNPVKFLPISRNSETMEHKLVSPITAETVCLHCRAGVVFGIEVISYCAYCGHKVCFRGGCIDVHARGCAGFAWSRVIEPKQKQQKKRKQNS